MKTKINIFILTAVHNELEYLKKFLLCVQAQTYPLITTVIIDDGSTDGTDKFIKEKYPQVILLAGDGNLWWTGSLYLGIEKILTLAKPADFVLTINADCQFDKNYVMDLFKFSQKYPNYLIGSVALDITNKDKIVDAGVQIDWTKGKFIALGPQNYIQIPSNQKARTDIDTLSTKGTLIPKAVIERIGNFDKKHLPHYLSDYEFACRAKKYGFGLAVSLKSKVYNDAKRTGLEKFEGLNFSDLMKQFFARKSKMNLIDLSNFVNLSCPLRYKPANYCFLLRNTLHFISFTKPFKLLRLLLRKNYS